MFLAHKFHLTLAQLGGQISLTATHLRPQPLLGLEDHLLAGSWGPAVRGRRGISR